MLMVFKLSMILSRTFFLLLLHNDLFLKLILEIFFPPNFVKMSLVLSGEIKSLSIHPGTEILKKHS